MNDLIRCPLFKGLDNDGINSLLEQVLHRVKSYSEEQLVIVSGDECNALQIVLSGSVRGEMVDFSGKTIKIEDIESPRPLAVAFLFGGNNHYPVNIVTNSDVSMLIIPKESVLKMMQLNQQFLLNFMNVVSNRAQFLSERIRFLSFQTIKGKIAHYLLNLAGKEQQKVILPESQAKLAELFGVARPSLARTIREMHNDGVISAQGKEITIENRPLLVSFLNQ